MLSFTKSNLSKLETLFSEQNYKVRYEKGNFNSGYCIVEHRKIVIVNKFYDVEGRINVLLDILSTIEIDHSNLSEKSVKLLKQIIKAQEDQLNQVA